MGGVEQKRRQAQHAAVLAEPAAKLIEHSSC